MEFPYPPLQHAFTAQDHKWSTADRERMPLTYHDDIMRWMKTLCKMIRLELETPTMSHSLPRQITRCLYAELDLLADSEDIWKLMNEFTKKFVLEEAGRKEALQIIQAQMTCSVESDGDSEGEEDCMSECGTDCDESTEPSERSGYHRMRMTIRELLGSAGRVQVLYKKQKRRLRRRA